MKIIFNNNGQDYGFYIAGDNLYTLNDYDYSPCGITMSAGPDYYGALEGIMLDIRYELECRHNNELRRQKLAA